MKLIGYPKFSIYLQDFMNSTFLLHNEKQDLHKISQHKSHNVPVKNSRNITNIPQIPQNIINIKSFAEQHKHPLSKSC